MTIMPCTDCVTSELLFGLSEMVDHSPSSMFARTSAMRLFAVYEIEKGSKKNISVMRGSQNRVATAT